MPRLLLLAALALPALFPSAASADTPERDFLFGEERFGSYCRPPLKFAAGACVPRCPAGFQDMGRTCRFRPQNR